LEDQINFSQGGSLSHETTGEAGAASPLARATRLGLTTASGGCS
jgi:hypothetical protein